MDLEQYLEQLTKLAVYPRSVVQAGGSTYFLGRSDKVHRQIGTSADRHVLGVLGDVTGFEGTPRGQSASAGDGRLLLCPLTATNAAALRTCLPWLRPVPLGLQASVGFGDRLGLATPGHVRAVRGTGIAPVFAQQSVRENTRTGRTPQQVLDDAMWGVFQEGWRDAWGADADHLKTPSDVGAFIAAGYTFFTVDPGDHVDNAAQSDPDPVLVGKVADLPWDTLESSPQDLEERYLGSRFQVENLTLEFDRSLLLRAACKYGRAVAHTVAMYRHLATLMAEKAPSTSSGQAPSIGPGQAFEFEVSVDETETPTSVHEHFYIANELRRLGVEWVSLAPRFIGRFEKGVDYIGDLDEFEVELAEHAAIARALGPYKLSLHTGSDKFSIYPIIAQYAGDLVHLKTAGTSYLEALRAIAQVDTALFREILAFGRERYDTDRATYYVSAELANVAVPGALGDADLPALLGEFDARQVLHVTFGSALDRFGGRLLATLREHEGIYYRMLAAHFRRHLAAFIGL